MKEKLRKFTENRKVRQAGSAAMQIGWLLGSAALSAAVLLWMLPAWLVLVVCAVIIAHELGHYVMAKAFKQNAKLPFFIPFIIGVLGTTYVPGCDLDVKRWVAMAGPAAGGLVAVGFLLAAAALSATPMMWAAVWMLVFQIWAATFGSDGRKWRASTATLRAQMAEATDLEVSLA